MPRPVPAHRVHLSQSALGRAPLFGAWVVAGLGPTVSLLAYGRPFWPHALGVAVITALAVIALRLTTTLPWSWLALTPIAATAGATSFLLGGRLVGLWTALAVIAAGWGVLGQPPLPRLRPPDRSVRITLIALAVLSAAIYNRTNVAPRYALLLTAAGFVAITISTIDHPAVRTPRQWITRGAHALGTAINAVLMTLLWATAILLPGAIQRLLRWDPTGIAGRPAPRWIARTPQPHNQQRPWLAEPTTTRPTPTQRLHGALTSITTAATLTTLAALAALAYGTLPTPQLLPNPDNTTPPEIIANNDVEAATRAEPWFDGFSREYDDMTRRSWFSQWAGWEFADFHGLHLNVADRERHTWRPPRSSCPNSVVVWMFGGSTLWGIGNRDDHTVPSAFARAAYLDGVGLEVHNFGMPGEVAWQHLARFEREFSITARPPNLVVFYDGANDAVIIEDVNGTDRLARWDYFGSIDPDKIMLSDIGGDRDDGEVRLSEREQIDPIELSVDEVVDRSIDQYVATHDRAQYLLDSENIPFAHVNQPVVYTREPEVKGEAERSEEFERYFTQFRDGLPDGIIDLTTIFDDVPTPHFLDEVHLDDGGNDVVGESLYRVLGTELEPLVAESEAQCS